MKIYKRETQSFEPYTVDWGCTNIPDGDWDTRRKTLVKCAYCGKDLLFMDSIRSRFILPDDAQWGDEGCACCFDCVKEKEFDDIQND